MNVSVETPRTEFDFEDCREQYMYVRDTKYTIAPVSYTHLTLPTIYSV